MLQLKQMIVDFEYNGSRMKLLLSRLVVNNFVPCVLHDLLNNRILIFFKQDLKKNMKWKKYSFLYLKYLYHNVINKKPICVGNF